MNPYLQQLQPYPFEKIRRLLADTKPPNRLAPISLAMGEPKHPPPEFVLDVVRQQLHQIAQYPATKGIDALRTSCAQWLTQRFELGDESLDPEHHILPVNGTREALFAFAQVIVDSRNPGLVAFPNPFYQIYEGATLLAGAQPHLINCAEETGQIPDFDGVAPDVWQQCQLLYICTPGNPTGAVLSVASLQKLIALADEFDFVIASDECYSEIYPDEANPPPGLLEACEKMGRKDFKRCVVFHSLSKRSNLPGLRSGFVAGDADLLSKFLQYRTYHGCAMSLPFQLASIAAWNDEQHVRENREQYRRKFSAVIDILQPVMDVTLPDAGFYLWPNTPISDTDFTLRLYQQAAIQVVPGSYLARDTDRGNPGANRIRMALVAEVDQCIEAAHRIRSVIEGL